MTQYKNRYGDIYTFELDENKNIVWKGDFKWCRYGWPNVYKEAYESYCKDASLEGETPMHIEEFKKEVHHYVYDHEGKYVGPGEIANKYATAIYSDTKTINMVDPSGGPYMTSDMELDWLGEEFNELSIRKFEPTEEGYLILTYNRYEHLAEYNQVGGIINTKEK